VATRMITRLTAIFMAALFVTGAYGQESPANFYAGKTINLFVGYSPGGGYDRYARLIARHMPRHMPGTPNIVVKNMPGAGSLKLANHLFNVAPRDGTAFGTVARGIAMEPLLGGKGAQYDAQMFNWIGSANNEVSVCVAWHTAGIESFDDLYTEELIVGGAGAGADTDTFPIVLNNLFGTKMKLITGYPGGNEVTLAMERGEVGGRCGWSWSTIKTTHADWVQNGTLRVLIQMSLHRHTDLSDVPLIMDKAKAEEQRQILRVLFARQVMGRPYVAPPDVPADRVTALRRAFVDTLADPELLAEAERAKIEIGPIDGQTVASLIRDLYATPPEIIKKASEAARR
jgi:tripartite-type tricarboxylate transporter receptor subunit TctC